jgi:hypothetical protein
LAARTTSTSGCSGWCFSRCYGGSRASWPRDGKTWKLADADLPPVVFAFKAAAETLLGPLPNYGVVPRRRIGNARAFVMPGPTAPTAEVDDAVKKLKRALRATG